MKKLYWRIRGYDSLEQVFDRTVDEIVGAYATRRTKASVVDEHGKLSRHSKLS